jgi:hypothetical protein
MNRGSAWDCIVLRRRHKAMRQALVRVFVDRVFRPL